MGNKGLDESIGDHFGRVPTFTLIDVETNNVEILENTSHHLGGAGYPPNMLKENNVGTLICSNLGHRAVSMFENLGICVYIGAYGKVKDAMRMWKCDMLHQATDETSCKQHMVKGENKGPGCGN